MKETQDAVQVVERVPGSQGTPGLASSMSKIRNGGIHLEFQHWGSRGSLNRKVQILLQLL